MEHLKNKQFNSFGVYTSSELFSNRTLRACKFTNMEIPKMCFSFISFKKKIILQTQTFEILHKLHR